MSASPKQAKKLSRSCLARVPKFSGTVRHDVETLSKKLSRAAALHFVNAVSRGLSDDDRVRMSNFGREMLGNMLYHFCSLVVDAAVRLAKQNNRQTLFWSDIKTAVMNLPSVPMKDLAKWNSSISDNELWTTVNTHHEIVEDLRKKTVSVDGKRLPPVRLSKMYADAGVFVDPALMKHVLADLVPKSLRFGGDRPAAALAVGCAVFLDKLSASYKKALQQANVELAGSTVIPRNLVLAIKLSKIVRSLFPRFNAVGASVGLLTRVGKRRSGKRAASGAAGGARKKQKTAMDVLAEAAESSSADEGSAGSLSDLAEAAASSASEGSGEEEEEEFVGRGKRRMKL
jgi:histone H3/H4